MKILVCMDSSVYADEILNSIFRREWTADAQFRLITVVETSGIADNDNQVLHQAEQILSARAQNLQERLTGNAHIISEVLEGHPATTINQAAEDCSADLILIGSHGDTGIRKSGIGSVAAAVVNDAPCSVEVVKLKSNRSGRRAKTDALIVSKK